MDSIIKLFEDLFEKAKDYGSASIELFKLKLIEKTTSIVAVLITILIVFFCFMMFIIPLNVGIALLLGDILGKLWYGFLIVSGFYLLVIIIVLLFFRNSLKRYISTLIIKMIFK
jgi:hypothetical protein